MIANRGDTVPEIRIAMAYFTAPRSAIADRLVTLHEAGAAVRVLVSRKVESPPANNAPVAGQLLGAGIEVRVLPRDPEFCDTSRGRMHSKYLLLRADYPLYGEVAERRLVFTGSHNYTGAALDRNEEVLLRVDSPGVYAGYGANFDSLWALAVAAPADRDDWCG